MQVAQLLTYFLLCITLSLCCVTDEIQRFMEEVKSLGYKDRPQYEKLRLILQAGLKAIQAKDDGKLEFTSINRAVSPPALVRANNTHTQKQQLKYFK